MDATQKPALAWLSAALSISVTRVLATVRKAVRHVRVRRTQRSLRVCESLALGDRRFLLLVQCDRRRYLIGAATQSITLVDRLDEKSDSTLDEIPPAGQVPWKGLH